MDDGTRRERSRRFCKALKPYVGSEMEGKMFRLVEVYPGLDKEQRVGIFAYLEPEPDECGGGGIQVMLEGYVFDPDETSREDFMRWGGDMLTPKYEKFTQEQLDEIWAKTEGECHDDR